METRRKCSQEKRRLKWSNYSHIMSWMRAIVLSADPMDEAQVQDDRRLIRGITESAVLIMGNIGKLLYFEPLVTTAVVKRKTSGSASNHLHF